MSKKKNRNFSGIAAIFLLIIATIGVIYFVSSRGDNLNFKNAFEKDKNEGVEIIENVDPTSEISEEIANKLAIYRIIEDEIRSQITNKSKASMDVLTSYVKKNPQALNEGYDYYPFEIQTASGRVREEINKNEEFVLVISENNIIKSNDESEGTDSIEIGDTIDIEGILEIEADEHPFGRLYRITSEDEENPRSYYILFQTEKSDKTFEDSAYKKVRVKTKVSDIAPDKITYTYISGPIEIR